MKGRGGREGRRRGAKVGASPRSGKAIMMALAAPAARADCRRRAGEHRRTPSDESSSNGIRATREFRDNRNGARRKFVFGVTNANALERIQRFQDILESMFARETKQKTKLVDTKSD